MKSLLIAVALAFALVSVPASASAQTITAECEADIASLTTLTENTVFIGARGLFFQTKLLSDLSKAAAGNIRDALQAMKGYESDLAGAVDNAVIAPVDAAALRAGAEVVIACLKAIPKK